MSYFAKLAKLGFMVVCRANRLGTTTMFAVTADEIDEDFTVPADEVLDRLPEWRLVDFSGDDAAKGAQMLYEKLTMTGMYVGYDERMKSRLLTFEDLIGFEHRPESERFQPVE